MNNLLRTLLLLAALVIACVVLAVRLAGPRALLPAMLLAALLAGALLLGAGRLLLALYGARPADETTAPGLVRLVDELAHLAGLPAPRLWIVDDRAPSAFATGTAPRGAAIAVTTGLLELLPERELRAVLAHELAHIRRHDTRAASLCVTLAGVVPMLALAAFGSAEDDEAGVPGSLLAALALLAAGVLLLALDRQRDYAADRFAAQLCGDADALAQALGRIERAAAGTLPRAARRHPLTAALLIVPPPLRGWRRFTAGQPSAEGRIRRLRALADDPQFLKS